MRKSLSEVGRTILPCSVKIQEGVVELRFYQHPQDYDHLRKLLIETGHFDPTIDDVETLSSAGIWREHCIIVAIKKSELVGCVFMEAVTRWSCIWRVAVTGSEQRQGIGTAMMTCAKIILKKTGIEKVQLWLEESNSQALNFYRKHGFVPSTSTFLLMHKFLQTKGDLHA